MYYEVTCSDWDEFHSIISAIRQKWEHENNMLFRGVSDSSHLLQTTLERAASTDFGECSILFEYYCITHRCAPMHESLSGLDFDLPDPLEFKRELDSKISLIFPKEVCRHWIHLRHIGFPSPLLDWSASPYVASFFAMHEESGAEYAAVYVLIKQPALGVEGEVSIYSWGPFINTHKRHVFQQSRYTIAAVKEQGCEYMFANHMLAFGPKDGHKDVLIKILIPRVERDYVLYYLHDHNINPFSLFGSEESLAQTLSYKEFKLSSEFMLRGKDSQKIINFEERLKEKNL